MCIAIVNILSTLGKSSSILGEEKDAKPGVIPMHDSITFIMNRLRNPTYSRELRSNISQTK